MTAPARCSPSSPPHPVEQSPSWAGAGMGTLLLLPEASSLPGPAIDEPPAAPHHSPGLSTLFCSQSHSYLLKKVLGKVLGIFQLWQVTTEGKLARGWAPFTFTTQVAVY